MDMYTETVINDIARDLENDTPLSKYQKRMHYVCVKQGKRR